LLEFFENGGTVDLEEGRAQRGANVIHSEMPEADPETIAKAESVLKLLTTQMEQLDARCSQSDQNLRQQVQDEKTALEQGLPCELERMLIEQQQAEAARETVEQQQGRDLPEPSYELDESDEAITLRVALPNVTRVGRHMISDGLVIVCSIFRWVTLKQMLSSVISSNFVLKGCTH